MIDVSSDVCNNFISTVTASDLPTVEAVMAAEYEYLYGLGLVDGPEPDWVVMDPHELNLYTYLMGSIDHQISHRDYLASKVEDAWGIPASEVLVILEAEVSFLLLHGVIQGVDIS
ncbi:MAG: hypothetical protein ACKOFX_06510 [Solirubrobacterales bacterium]